MPIIPEDKLMQIKDAAPIEEVVGQVVKLVQRGKNLVGLCPFHPDTAPSFTVSPDRGIFHCFGCAAGGNVFSFVMQYHKLSFPEAVQELARRYNIPLTFKDLGPEGSRQAKKRQLWFDLSNWAAAFYRATLEGSEGRPGRDYLAKRGMTPEVIKDFSLGYAPAGWDGLARHLQSRGASLDAAQEIGLVLPRPQGGFYDRFRNRIMFPILDRSGRVVAFGGRAIDTAEPKYLNSPETPLYSKGRLLYGLPQAGDALRGQGVAILVEGYLDLLALRVHHIEPVLATLGTALTKEHVRLLKNQVSKVVLVFDGDAAGARAMRRAFPLFAEEHLAVRVLPLPEGLDPDTYAFKHGVDIFKDPWDAAQPWFAFLLEELIKAHGLAIEGRVSILEELRPHVQALTDPVEQGLWLKFTAERLKVDEATLRHSLTSWAPLAPGRVEPSRNLALNLERSLLKWVLQHPAPPPLEDLEEWAREFEEEKFKEVIDCIIRYYREHGGLDLSLLLQQVEAEELRQNICALTLGEGDGAGCLTQIPASDWSRALRIRRLKKDRLNLKERLKKAASTKEGEDIAMLLAQSQEIDQQLEALKNPSAAKGENA